MKRRERNIDEYDSMAAGFDAANGKYDKKMIMVKVRFVNTCPACGRVTSYSSYMDVESGAPAMIFTQNLCGRCS